MANFNSLPPPHELEIHAADAHEKWKKFEIAWSNYCIATNLYKKSENVQVATLLTVIGEEARDVYSTFTDWENAGDERKMKPVMEKFREYCQPQKNVPFERFKFNRRKQEVGESYDQYKTALRKLAQSCEFDKMTPDEMLRDRIIFGINDSKVRERLLRESNLTLHKTDRICRASESMLAQMKIVSGDEKATSVSETTGTPEASINAVSTGSTDNTKKKCGNCGRKHGPKEHCPAQGKTCNKCGKFNHFANVCRGQRNYTQRVRAVDVEEDENGIDDCFIVHKITAGKLDDSQLVTLRFNSGNFLRFQPDTGAQCNVIPVQLYKQASKDYKLKKVKPCDKVIVAYGGSQLRIVGQSYIRLWRGDFHYLLDCKIVESEEMRPLLGRKACIAMNIIKYNDNDAINKPDTGDAQVFAVEDTVSTAITKEALIAAHPQVFSDRVGRLDGEYHININPDITPAQHAPRKVPVALREKLKETLTDLADQEIIAQVTTPTSWVSSLVVVPKSQRS